MGRWKRFRSLPREERLLRLRALRTVAAVRVRLWLLPFARVRRWAGRVPAVAAAGAPSPADVDRAVRSAGAFVPAATCLVKALAAQVLLRRAGVECGLRLGLAKEEGGGLDAHAWVECADGTVVGDRGRADYAALAI